MTPGYATPSPFDDEVFFCHLRKPFDCLLHQSPPQREAHAGPAYSLQGHVNHIINKQHCVYVCIIR